MFKSDDGARARANRAAARGERIRAELIAKLSSEGPKTAPELLPQLPSDVSLSEVAFQLARLSDEGFAVGEEGAAYRLSG